MTDSHRSALFRSAPSVAVVALMFTMTELHSEVIITLCTVHSA
jgi:hypothetical protein